MLKFTAFTSPNAPRPARMTLREYALFSELCLKSNPKVTPENCMARRIREKGIDKRFCLRPAPGKS